MIFLLVGYVFIEPFRGNKGFGSLLASKFYFRYNQWSKGRIKDIQFYGQMIIVGRQRKALPKDRVRQRNQITPLGYDLDRKSVV